MANGKIRFGKQSGGTLGLVFPDGATNTEVVLPESGTLVSVGTTVTDNAIVRFDGTTGAVQNSSAIIDDSGNITLSSNRALYINGTNNHVYADTSAMELSSATKMMFVTNGAQRMLINSSGNVLIGTTTDNGVDKLQVNGSISSGLVNIVTDLNEVKRNGSFVTGDFTFSLPSNANASSVFFFLYSVSKSGA